MKNPRRYLALTLALSSLVGVSVLGSSAASARTGATSTTQGAADYIVRFTKGTNVSNEVAAQRKQGVVVSRTYSHVFPGAVMRLNGTQLAALRKNPRVTAIEADGVVSIDDTQSNATWGLDRIDQRTLPLSGSFTYSASGSGVTAYIVDTGILAGHNEFGGRVTSGFDAFGGTGVDCNGHGTHVAGTVGGTTYGVAKNVTLVPVRVLDCSGSGQWSGVVAGLDWIVANHAAGVPAVANMSLGGGASTSIDTAVQSAVADGVTMVVAAGNSNANACNYSPARAASAITVGATTSSDSRASYSNFGTCLDIFAPGSSITSAWYTSATSTNTISGTSMASPHVAGAAAVLLSIDPTLSPAGVVSSLTASATADVVTSAVTGSPNLLLFLTSSTTPPPPPPSATAPSAPTNVTASAGRRSAVVSWTQGANGGSALTGQTVNVYRGTSRIGSVNVSGTAVSVNIGGLTGGVTYTFRVTATNAIGTSPESASSNAVTVRK